MIGFAPDSLFAYTPKRLAYLLWPVQYSELISPPLRKNSHEVTCSCVCVDCWLAMIAQWNSSAQNARDGLRCYDG